MTVQGNCLAYADSFSGISGDMFVGSLLDAGMPLEVLTEALRCVDLDGYRLDADIASTDGAIVATRFTVTPLSHHHPRNWQAIRDLIATSSLADTVRSRALAIFQCLAEAEAKVHGCPVDQVHFHEVGAVDSIVDIVCAAVGIDYFSIGRLASSPLPLGRGIVETCHGTLPLPAPAVCELVRDIPSYGIDLAMELVTPTGAAIVKACAQSFGPLPPMTIRKIGYGAGSRRRPDRQPNVFRLFVGEAKVAAESQEVIVIETNLDDWAPETFPYLCERLFAHGALDVSLSPIQMKKGRAGFVVQVIAAPADAFALQQIVLSETSAIGVRFRREERHTLPRKSGTVATRYGTVKVKRVALPFGGERITPEYEDCRRLALETGTPIIEIYRAVTSLPPDSVMGSLEKIDAP